MKTNTILYKDNNSKYYIGEIVDGALTGFKNIAINTQTDKEADTFHHMDIHQFMILTIEDQEHSYKLTPLKIGSMALDEAKDGYGEAVKTQVHAIPLEEKLTIFNNILKSFK